MHSSSSGSRGFFSSLHIFSGHCLFAIIPVCALFLGLLAFTGCESTISTRLPDNAVGQRPVVLSPGDVVKVTYPGEPDYNQSQKIQADGKINLPIIGEVKAAGETISSLQHKLEARYGPELQNSEVVVTLDSQVIPIVIAGAVQKPAKYFFDRPTTVFQAVMEAGGPDQFGTLGRVNLTRLVNGQQRTEVMDLRPITHGEAVKPRYVQAGDVIVVGESRF
jgi:polysaccharide export outer membrane protein